MTIFLLLLGVAILILFLFNSDRNKVKKQNLSRGGLKTRFPNFVQYCNSNPFGPHNIFEFVKDDGEYLEYRYSLPVQNSLGFFHLVLQHNFGTFLYVYAISPKGKKINGRFLEIKSDNQRKSPDLSIYEYDNIFSDLIWKMEKSKDFPEKFMDLK